MAGSSQRHCVGDSSEVPERGRLVVDIDGTPVWCFSRTFRAMDAEHTLLWSSDWPHWDFDLRGRLFQLPFLSERDNQP